MNNKLFNLLLFTAGAAVGSVVTWKIVKTKYERLAQEEIDSVKETWARWNRQESGEEATYEDDDVSEYECEDEPEETEEGEDVFDESDHIAYHLLANKYSKSGEEAENDGEGEGDEEVPYINGPVVIMPEDFGDGNYDHDCYCLVYYADGVLSNDWYETFDVEETIGEDALEHFGDYTEDVVHVRNERLNADYEVTRDPRNYADMVANDPLMHMHAN